MQPAGDAPYYLTEESTESFSSVVIPFWVYAARVHTLPLALSGMSALIASSRDHYDNLSRMAIFQENAKLSSI